jgi:hypothetical protein
MNKKMEMAIWMFSTRSKRSIGFNNSVILGYLRRGAGKGHFWG